MHERNPLIMRATCRFGCSTDAGYVTEVNGQKVVRCALCNKAQYNAPLIELGLKPRSIAAIHDLIKPKQRWRILERSNGRCELCGAKDELHVDHLVSVAIGLRYGLTETELNSDENLAAFCIACNLGKSDLPLSPRLYAVLLRERIQRLNEAQS